MQKDIKEKINLRDNFSYYFEILKPYFWLLVIILVIVFFYAGIEVGQNYLLKLLIDEAGLFAANTINTAQFVEFIFLLAIIYFVSMIISSILKYHRITFLNTLETSLIFDAKADIFNHLIRLSHSFHTTNRTGSLISKMIRIGKGIESLTDFITFHGSPLILKLLISFVIIALFDLQAAIIVLLACIAFIIYSFVVLGQQQKANIERNDAEDYEKGFISDVFTNIETIKHFGKENQINFLFDKVSTNSRNKLLKFWDYYAVMDIGFILIFGFGTIALMYFTLDKFILGQITIGSLVFIYTSYLGLVNPLTEFMWGVRRTYEAMSDIQGVVEFRKVKMDVADKIGAKELKIKKGEIVFENIKFNYGRKDVIKKFNLKIKPNEKVAFVGHSGAGKTTLVKLLYRLYDVKEGKILVDGNDIRELKQESLRNELSIVPQECVLFNDTIYNNVLFSNPKATKKQFLNALKVAQLYDFVKELPEKENTIVGERGIKLSGGEKQRLSIARAVIANKKVLVLDEATSSLDSVTEKEIQKSLFKLMEGKTTIIIAHRLSTIMQADKIIVMEKGEIKQIGSHEELTNKKGLYKKLWELQKSKAIRA